MVFTIQMLLCILGFISDVSLCFHLWNTVQLDLMLVCTEKAASWWCSGDHSSRVPRTQVNIWWRDSQIRSVCSLMCTHVQISSRFSGFPRLSKHMQAGSLVNLKIPLMCKWMYEMMPSYRLPTHPGFISTSDPVFTGQTLDPPWQWPGQSSYLR